MHSAKQVVVAVVVVVLTAIGIQACAVKSKIDQAHELETSLSKEKE